MKNCKLYLLLTYIRSCGVLILSVLVSPIAFAQDPQLVTPFAEIEQQDSILKEQAWALPAWENVDADLVNRIKQRLAQHSVVTKYSGMLVYFAYGVDPQTKNPGLPTRPKLDTLLKGYRLYAHHFRPHSQSLFARYQGQYLNAVGINFFRSSQMDSAYYYCTLAEGVFRNAAGTALGRTPADSSQLLSYLDSYSVILSNLHLPIIYTNNPNDKQSNQLARASRMLSLLNRADSINKLVIKLSPDSCYARNSESTIALNTANVYFQLLKDSLLAAPYFRKALRAITSCQTDSRLTNFYNTVAEGYMINKLYGRAKTFSYEGLRYEQKRTELDTEQYGSVVELHGRLAICYGMEQQYDSLRKYALLVLRDSARFNYLFNETLILTTLCELAFKQGRDEDVQIFFPLLKSRMTRPNLFSQESFILKLDNERTRAELEQRYERLSQQVEGQADHNYSLLTIMLTSLIALICFSIAAFVYTRKRKTMS